MPGFSIEPDRFYFEHELLAAGLFDEDELRKARKSGALKFKQLSRSRRVYFGKWLLAWLAGEDPGPAAPPQQQQGPE